MLTQDLGVPCYTAKPKITDWFLTNGSAKKRVVFTTYQSSPVLAESARKAKVVFDLGIMDEAHKTTGRAEALFAHLLHDSNVAIGKRLFMTATERRYKGSSDQIIGMDDKSLYGDTFYLLSFRDALLQEPKVISDYRILTLIITKGEIASLIENNNFIRPATGRWSEDIEAEMLAALVAMKKAMREYPIKHVVSFHSSISRAKVFRENAEVFTQSFPEYGPLDTYHVAGSDPSSVREKVLIDFGASPAGLVTNAKCLTEGVDLPVIDCVIFADPKKSTVDIVQALGRALRPAESKDFGYIVVPVIYDEQLGIEAFWASDAFSNLVATLRALASNDERIIDYFRAVAYGRSSRSSLQIHENVIATSLVDQVDLKEFVEAIDLQCWESMRKLSYSSFKTARSFARGLGLHNAWEWQQYCQDKLFRKPVRPRNIPDNPSEVYSKEWNGWADWLGLHSAGGTYLKFEYAREYVRHLELATRAGWNNFVDHELSYLQRPDYIHPNPDIIYYNEWVGWEDWLGERKYWPFETAKSYAIELKLLDEQQWYRHWQKDESLNLKPDKIPLNPQFVYEKQWKGWTDWLGADRAMPYKEALGYAHSLGLRSRREWSEYWSDAAT